MPALGVIFRGLIFLAQHPAVHHAFKQAFRAGATELIRHAQRHIRMRGSMR